MGRIPDELVGFLRKGQNALVIKGGPGTGKTILSLELLRLFSKDRTCIYLGTRVSADRLLDQHPWLKGAVEPHYSLSFEAPAKGRIAVSDTRFRGSPIEQLYEAAMEAENPFVVVDSWDVLAGRLEPSERHKAFEVLESLLASKNANLVFVSETTGETSLDYQADGIAVLGIEDLGGRRLRILELRKLRGTRLPQTEYLFSLENGRFHHLPCFSFKPNGERARWKPIPDSETHFTTGSNALDELLGGGYPRGSTVLLDYAADVPMMVYTIIPMMASANFVSQGRGVVSIISERWGVEKVREFSSGVVGHQAFDRFTRLLADEPSSPERPYNVCLSGGDIDADYDAWRRAVDSLREETGQPVLKITSLRTQTDRYGKEPYLKAMAKAIARNRVTGGLEIRTTVPGIEDVTLKAAELADIHLRIESRFGCSYLYGIKPFTAIHRVGVRVTKGIPKLDLTPVF